jgi:hypothetical protein
MMVVDFKWDQEVLKKDLAASPVSADPAALEETYFVMPVRFSVDGVNLLSMSADQAHSLPLLGFSTHVLQMLEHMQSTDEGRVYLAGGGDVSICTEGQRVRIRSSLTNREVTVDREALLSAFRSFADCVKHQLVTWVPGIDRHPHWRTWFRPDRPC